MSAADISSRNSVPLTFKCRAARWAALFFNQEWNNFPFHRSSHREYFCAHPVAFRGNRAIAINDFRIEVGRRCPQRAVRTLTHSNVWAFWLRRAEDSAPYRRRFLGKLLLAITLAQPLMAGSSFQPNQRSPARDERDRGLFTPFCRPCETWFVLPGGLPSAEALGYFQGQARSQVRPSHRRDAEAQEVCQWTPAGDMVGRRCPNAPGMRRSQVRELRRPGAVGTLRPAFALRLCGANSHWPIERCPFARTVARAGTIGANEGAVGDHPTAWNPGPNSVRRS